MNWLNFLTYAITTAGTPGPNNIASMSNASQKGLKKALPFNLGIWCGFVIVTALCALFCTTLSALVPTIKRYMLYIGAAYMLYLAWKTFKSGSIADETGKKQGGFWAGFCLQFVNVKILIYCISVMQIYAIPYADGDLLKMLFFILFLPTNGFIFTVLWALFGTVFKLLFSKYARITNTIMALLLVYCAVALFL